MIRKKTRQKGTVFEAIVRFKGRKVSKSFESYVAASKWQTEQRHFRDKGKEPYSRSVTIDELHKAYFAWAKEKNRTLSTLNLAESRFKNYLKPWYRDVNMVEVTQEEHQAFFNYLREQEVSPALRNRIRSQIQVAHSVAIKNRFFGGVFTRNPIQSIDKADEETHAVKFWTKAEKASFLEANKDSPDYPLFFFLLHTGVRINEAFGAVGEQIDTSSQILTVDRHFNLVEGKVVYHTKGKRIRSVYLIDEVLELLDPKPGLPLFRNSDGGVRNYYHFAKKVFPNACQAAKVRNIGPHGTRHTFASHYMMDGGSLWDLSKILGHSSTEVTESRYGHFDLAHVRGRMKVIERNGNIVRANFG